MKHVLLNLAILLLLNVTGVFAQPKTLGPNINSVHQEIRPIQTPDGSKLFFVVEGSKQNPYKDGQDIWMSKKDENGEWQKAERLPNIINRNRYNAVYWTSADGNTLLIRGKYDEKTNKSYRGFSIVNCTNGEWSMPQPVKIKDYESLSRGIYTGAVLSTDQKVLIMYLSTERNGDVNDIWASILNDSTMEYETPFKLNISEEDYDEFSPYLASDNKTLFFASDRPGGFGSADIWMSKRMDSTWKMWSIPVNIGAPFNTKYWDAYFSIGEADSVAIFSTNKKHSLPSVMGGADLFSAVLPETFRPEKPAEPIHDTIIITVIKCDTIYKVIPCNPLDTMSMDNLKKELTKGKILFDYGSSTLRSDAYKKLDIISVILQKNPDMKIELSGHTDAMGSIKGNLKQSIERAQSARSYLLAKGIDNSRIGIKGYGDKTPVGSNKTDEGRQLNRRVDIIIQQD